MFRKLAAEFGTPLYIYDAAIIRERFADLETFDVVRYAQKACSNLAILDLLRHRGAMIDAVGADEIRRALTAGYTAEKREDGVYPIVYTADIFDRDALDLCIEKNIHVNCGSIDMIDQLGARCAPGREITLRINPGFGHGHSRKTNTGGDLSKHGIWYDQLHQAMERALRYDMRIVGLHMHIGSGTDLEHLSQVAEAMVESARQVGTTLETISCGGGLPIPYRDNEERIDLLQYRALWRDAQAVLAREFRHPVRLEIEPGRYLVAESGSLVTEIRAVKTQGGNLFYLVDAGFNNLARPIMYGAYHPITILVADSPDQGAEPTAAVDAVVGGPLCESGDIFTQEEEGFVVRRRLPRAQVGDLLVIGKTGAYGSVMASNYNSKPLAAEILLDGGEVRPIRRRQTFEQMIANEIF
ncbi:MAG TPA: diaminopimelate decarboxylase [Planctomycetaceae bacterium]|nr:diaminopimelate decarboxylase [Planctomycetaceae bacterium]